MMEGRSGYSPEKYSKNGRNGKQKEGYSKNKQNKTNYSPIIPYSNSNEYLLTDEFIPHFCNEGIIKSSDDINNLYCNYHENEQSEHEFLYPNNTNKGELINDSFGSYPMLHACYPNGNSISPKPKIIQKRSNGSNKSPLQSKKSISPITSKLIEKDKSSKKLSSHNTQYEDRSNAIQSSGKLASQFNAERKSRDQKHQGRLKTSKNCSQSNSCLIKSNKLQRRNGGSKSPNFHNESSFDQRQKNYHEFCVLWKQQIENKLSEQREIKAKEEHKECSFKPSILSTKNKSISKSK